MHIHVYTCMEWSGGAGVEGRNICTAPNGGNAYLPGGISITVTFIITRGNNSTEIY